MTVTVQFWPGTPVKVRVDRTPRVNMGAFVSNGIVVMRRDDISTVLSVCGRRMHVLGRCGTAAVVNSSVRNRQAHIMAPCGRCASQVSGWRGLRSRE